MNFEESDKIFRVTNQKRMLTIEYIGFSLATIAGLIVFVRVAKSCLSKADYFRGLDRECNMLFGSINDQINEQQFHQEMKAAELSA